MTKTKQKRKKFFIKVLLIDDEEEYYHLLKNILVKSERFDFDLTWTATYEKASEMILKNHFDVYFVDYYLDEKTGLMLIRQARDKGLKYPMILLTGRGHDNLDLNAKEDGATYLMDKSELKLSIIERNILFALEHEKEKATLNDALVNVISKRVQNEGQKIKKALRFYT